MLKISCCKKITLVSLHFLAGIFSPLWNLPFSVGFPRGMVGWQTPTINWTTPPPQSGHEDFHWPSIKNSHVSVMKQGPLGPLFRVGFGDEQLPSHFWGLWKTVIWNPINQSGFNGMQDGFFRGSCDFVGRKFNLHNDLPCKN